MRWKKAEEAAAMVLIDRTQLSHYKTNRYGGIMSGLLGAIAAGRMIGSAGQGHDSGAESRANAARNEAISAGQQANAMANNLGVAAVVIERQNEENSKLKVYANRLNANLIARKHSQHELLAALKESNYNHPLASEEGFEARVAELLAKQYGETDRRVAKNESWDDLPHIKKTEAEYALGREEGRKVL